MTMLVVYQLQYPISLRDWKDNHIEVLISSCLSPSATQDITYEVETGHHPHQGLGHFTGTVSFHFGWLSVFLSTLEIQ